MSEQQTPDIRFLREKLIPDLLSGAHRQTQGVLRRHTPDGNLAYCCLGRVCELWLADHPEQGDWREWEGGDHDSDVFVVIVDEDEQESSYQTLPDRLFRLIFDEGEASCLSEGFEWSYNDVVALITEAGIELTSNAKTWVATHERSNKDASYITMAGMNDHGFTFEQIAKIVSVHLDRLEGRNAIRGE